MTRKYFGGIIPEDKCPDAADDELKNLAVETYRKAFDEMSTYHCADSLATIFRLFRRANKYIDETTPWVLAKDETKKDRLASVIYNLSETIRFGAVLLPVSYTHLDVYKRQHSLPAAKHKRRPPDNCPI